MHAPQKLIRSRDITKVVGLARSTIYAHMAEGDSNPRQDRQATSWHGALTRLPRGSSPGHEPR